MALNQIPGADFDYYDDWHECDECGGSGEDESMCECESIEDICCCAVPTPMRCRTCYGRGGWHLNHGAEDQAMHEAENDAL